MRCSIADQSIRAFVKKLNSNKAGIRIRIDGPIEELKHQDYDGKRVHIIVSDETGNSVKTKLDIGVHADLSIEQREICFDVMATDGTICRLTRMRLFGDGLLSTASAARRASRGTQTIENKQSDHLAATSLQVILLFRLDKRDERGRAPDHHP